jgi:uncharacterized damage-inducible protein DinB
MKRMPGRIVLALLLSLLVAPRAEAQTGLTAELAKAMSDVESKILQLANVMNAAQYDWRPGEGVRSTGEVLMHISADNYFLPAVLGVAAPAATRISATDYSTVQAYERQRLGREETIADVRASFEHLQRALTQIPESSMDRSVQVFGQEFTTRGFLVMTLAHLHEHLGQLIAYARSNGVAPPWSR